jgi:dTDP-4-dehydrorhamnose reductase
VSQARETLLVTGGNGLLGTKLIELGLRDGPVRPVSASRQPCSNRFLGDFEFHQLDVTDASAVNRLLERVRPRWTIHTAAMTDVDGCEREPDAAWQANVVGAQTIADACQRLGAHLVQLSTEYVFDGRDGPYVEEDATNPINVYGQTKLASEKAVLDSCPAATIARTTVLYGHAPNARPNFVTWLVSRLRDGQKTRVVDDQIGSPTLADNLAEMCWSLALGDASGVYNTVGADVVDRYQLARLAAEVFRLDANRIEPVSTASLGQTAARPLRAGLRMDKFQRDFPQTQVIGAREGLEILREQLERQ